MLLLGCFKMYDIADRYPSMDLNFRLGWWTRWSTKYATCWTVMSQIFIPGPLQYSANIFQWSSYNFTEEPWKLLLTIFLPPVPRTLLTECSVQLQSASLKLDHARVLMQKATGYGYSTISCWSDRVLGGPTLRFNRSNAQLFLCHQEMININSTVFMHFFWSLLVLDWG